MRRTVVLMGSNVQPERHMAKATTALARAYRVAAVSPAFRTRPVGDRDQPDFLNAAAVLLTDDDPSAVERVLHAIESDLGRVRDPARPCGPRTIDLDIVVVEGVAEGPGAPDPLLLTEPFAALPVASVAPDLVHPGTGATMAEIARRLLAARPDAVAGHGGEAADG